MTTKQETEWVKFSDKQREVLLVVYDKCVEEGADKKTLAPLSALIFIGWPEGGW